MFKHPVVIQLADRAAKAKSAPAQAVAFRLLRLAESVADTDSKYRQNRSLSEFGRVESTRTDLTKMKLTHRFALARHAVQREANKIATMRADLEKKAFEKWATDAVAGEIRAAIKDKPMAEAIKLAASDARVLSAMVGVPSFLTGITREATAHLVDAHLQQHHADGLAAIEEHREAVNAASAALQVASETMRTAAGFSTDKALEDWLAANGPSKSDFASEDGGGVAPRQPTYNSVLSQELVGDDSLVGLAA
jgi:hypothetical protein